MTKAEETTEKPDYIGHRARLRERFMIDEGASMPDYEILELLLTMAIPRRDVKKLAKKLLKKFENLQTILHMPAHKLLDAAELPPMAIVLLRLFHTCMLRSSYNSFALSDEPIIHSWEFFEEYCWNLLAYKEIEESWIYFFDDCLHFKNSKQLSAGTINRAVVHPREILRTAIENKAAKIVLVHNHPSGISKPSSFDKAITAEIEELCDMMDMELYDHLIVATEGLFSFRAKGLIKPKKKSEDATGKYDKKLEEEEKKQKAQNKALSKK